MNWPRPLESAGRTAIITRRSASRLRPPDEDPQLANRRWAGIDRALVEAAPWLALYNPRVVVPLSRRVRGFRPHPVYGTLIDQLWLR